MKIQLLAGRFLDERDDEKAPRTSVINQTMARRYFPDRSPLGLIIQNPHGKAEVVGVVADVHNRGSIAIRRSKCICRSSRARPRAWAIVARTQQDPMSVANTIQRVIWTSIRDSRSTSLSTMIRSSRARCSCRACRRRCSHHLRSPLCYSQLSASTACCRIRCRSEQERLDCAWRSAHRAENTVALICQEQRGDGGHRRCDRSDRGGRRCWRDRWKEFCLASSPSICRRSALPHSRC